MLCVADPQAQSARAGPPLDGDVGTLALVYPVFSRFEREERLRSKHLPLLQVLDHVVVCLGEKPEGGRVGNEIQL